MAERTADETWLTVREVAAFLQLPERSVRYRLQKGQLRGVRGSGGWRIKMEDLQAFLKERANVEAGTWRRGLKGH